MSTGIHARHRPLWRGIRRWPVIGTVPGASQDRRPIDIVESFHQRPAAVTLQEADDGPPDGGGEGLQGKHARPGEGVACEPALEQTTRLDLEGPKVLRAQLLAGTAHHQVRRAGEPLQVVTTSPRAAACTKPWESTAHAATTLADDACGASPTPCRAVRRLGSRGLPQCTRTQTGRIRESGRPASLDGTMWAYNRRGQCVSLLTGGHRQAGRSVSHGAAVIDAWTWGRTLGTAMV